MGGIAGRTIDAVALLREREKLGLSEARRRVDEVKRKPLVGHTRTDALRGGFQSSRDHPRCCYKRAVQFLTEVTVPVSRTLETERQTRTPGPHFAETDSGDVNTRSGTEAGASSTVK